MDGIVRHVRRGWSRLIGLLHPRRSDSDLADELESHVAMQAEDNLRLGMSPEEARRAAVLKFGSIENTSESVRDQRGLPLVESLLKDAGYAVRGMRRNPGFAAAVIVTLALGIGANTAIFSVVYAALLRPLPYPDPDRIFAAEVVIPERSAQFPSIPVTVQAWLAFRRANTAFSSMAVMRPWECNLTGEGEPERVGGARVSANFFSFLGVPLSRGREFSIEEEQPGRERVVVISDALWRRRYGADPSLPGKSIELNGERHVIIGIAPASLLVPTGTQLHPLLPFEPRVDVWKPVAPTPAELQAESWDHGLLVRLRPGESAERGRQQLEALLQALIEQQSPGMKAGFLVQLVPVRELYAGNVRTPLLLILAASGILLLTACTNVANLLLTRIAGRAAEFATRIALGAGQARIISQMLAESTLLSVCGGLLGVAIATFGAPLLAAHGPAEVRMFSGSPLNLPVLLFALLMSIATGAACGLIPAWRAWRRNPSAELRMGTRSAFGGVAAARLRLLLVGMEIALGTVLLASAGLLLHSFIRIMQADRGYHVERVLAVDLSPFGERYRAAEARVAFYRELTSHIRALPGVLAAGAIGGLPAVSGSSGASRTIFHPTDTDFQSTVLARPVAMIRSVTPGYFAASGSVLQAGRFLGEQERTPVAVVSRSLVQQLWPRESVQAAIGRTFRQGDVTGPLIAVVGVVEDVRPGAMDRELPPLIYRPHEQWATGPMTLVIRTAQEPPALAAAVRAEIAKMDPNLPVQSMRTMREIISASVAQRRFQMLLTCLFALVTLVLGAVGVYGVVSYSVAGRTQEIGLRMALGAGQSRVLGWILQRAMQPVIIGLLLGLASALAVANTLRSMLFGITPADPVVFGLVASILLLTSGIACYVPARRAARLDPMTALRHE